MKRVIIINLYAFSRYSISQKLENINMYQLVKSKLHIICPVNLIKLLFFSKMIKNRHKTRKGLSDVKHKKRICIWLVWGSNPVSTFCFYLFVFAFIRLCHKLFPLSIPDWKKHLTRIKLDVKISQIDRHCQPDTIFHISSQDWDFSNSLVGPLNLNASRICAAVSSIYSEVRALSSAYLDGKLTLAWEIDSSMGNWL